MLRGRVLPGDKGIIGCRRKGWSGDRWVVQRSSGSAVTDNNKHDSYELCTLVPEITNGCLDVQNMKRERTNSLLTTTTISSPSSFTCKLKRQADGPCPAPPGGVVDKRLKSMVCCFHISHHCNKNFQQRDNAEPYDWPRYLSEIPGVFHRYGHKDPHVHLRFSVQLAFV